MAGSFAQLDPSPRLLLGPGPSQISPRVLRASGTPLLGHLDPEYLRMMDETQALLRRTFGTGNEWTICVPGTGMAGMEAALVNALEPGDEALICVHGTFGERMVNICERAGIAVRRARDWKRRLLGRFKRTDTLEGDPPHDESLPQPDPAEGIFDDVLRDPELDGQGRRLQGKGEVAGVNHRGCGRGAIWSADCGIWS